MIKGFYLALVAVACTPLAAKADLILGVLNTTGVAQISLGTIGFLDNEFSVNSPAAAQEGGFTALAGTTGTIQNLVNPPDATGPLDIPDFITFNSAPNITITLTFLLPGIDGSAGCTATPAAAGQLCTPDLPDQSPFDLQNTTPTSSTASFEILGTEVDSITGDTTPVTGIFTTQFADQNFQQLLLEVQNGDQVNATFSAQIFTTVPEPGTSIELAFGLMFLAVSWLCFVRRTKRVSQQ
jgi:hypothetical protein